MALKPEQPSVFELPSDEGRSVSLAKMKAEAEEARQQAILHSEALRAMDQEKKSRERTMVGARAASEIYPHRAMSNKTPELGVSGEFRSTGSMLTERVTENEREEGEDLPIDMAELESSYMTASDTGTISKRIEASLHDAGLESVTVGDLIHNDTDEWDQKYHGPFGNGGHFEYHKHPSLKLVTDLPPLGEAVDKYFMTDSDYQKPPLAPPDMSASRMRGDKAKRTEDVAGVKKRAAGSSSLSKVEETPHTTYSPRYDYAADFPCEELGGMRLEIQTNVYPRHLKCD